MYHASSAEEKGEICELSQTYILQAIHQDITNLSRSQIEDTPSFKEGFERKKWIIENDKYLSQVFIKKLKILIM